MSVDKSRGQAIFDNVLVGVILLLIASVVAAFFGFGPDNMTQDFRYMYVMIVALITLVVVVIYVFVKFVRDIFDSEGRGFWTFVYNLFAVILIVAVAVVGVYFLPNIIEAIGNFVGNYVYSH